ncbi:MICAL-like protein 2 isoform X6 [Desmodus rotundus]|uniref:MICAL-like protein 2 isoform X6 n=1 Tax=Desmodus rotundus TaxID=9430 RepID=UPI00238109E7|nr:MICAL-like protein 2 isoform X6 [Desmodus rotundus]
MTGRALQRGWNARNFDALRKENVYENNQLAFLVAEEQLGIPALLDAEDMVALKVPDRLSILTYVSQYYNYFHGRSPIGGLAGIKRSQSDSDEEPAGKKAPPQPARPWPAPARGQPLSPISTNAISQRKGGGAEGAPPKAGQASAGGPISSACGVCGQHVHLVQRHLADGKLYHRSCFRCKQCSNTLRPGAYRATAEPGVFVCSSHHPTATTASPTLPGPAPRQPGTAPTDSKPLSTPQTAQKAQRQRDQGPGARPATWELMVGNSTAKGFVPAAAHPRATTSSHVLSGSPAGPRLSASPMGGKASMCVTNSSPTVLSSPAQDTVAVSPCPAVTQSAPDPRLATQGWSAPQTKLSLSPVSAGQVNAPAWTLSASRTQQARERFLQTPGAMPSPGPAGRAPAAADTPSGVSHREQALSCLRKALPRLEGAGAQAPGRPKRQFPGRPGGWAGRVEGPPEARGEEEPSREGPRAGAAKGSEGAKGMGCAPEGPWELRGGCPHHPDPCDPCEAGQATGPSGPTAQPPSLDITGDWLQPIPLRQEAPAQSGKEGERPSPEDRPGKPSGPAEVPTPPGKAAASPVRLHPNHMPQEEIQREVQQIQQQLDILELKGVDLEKRLREAEGDASEDALMVDWFRLIHQKQLLLRLESELMYKSRDQHLEEQQLDIEGELRQLMGMPEGLKSPQDRQREQDLLTQYVSTVNHRSDIVDCLDEDRLREREEDEVLESMIRKLAGSIGLEGDRCPESPPPPDLQKKSSKKKSKIRWSFKGRSRTPE